MPAPYTEPTGADMSNIFNLFKFLSVGHNLMPIMLGVIWFIALIGSFSEGRQASRAFVFASFLTSILSIPLALVGMLNTNYMYLTFLLVGIGVIWHKLDNAPGI